MLFSGAALRGAALVGNLLAQCAGHTLGFWDLARLWLLHDASSPSGNKFSALAFSSARRRPRENSGRFRTTIDKPRVDGFMQPAGSVKNSRAAPRVSPAECRSR